MEVDVLVNRTNCVKQILMGDNLRSFNECPELCEEVLGFKLNITHKVATIIYSIELLPAANQTWSSCS